MKAFSEKDFLSLLGIPLLGINEMPSTNAKPNFVLFKFSLIFLFSIGKILAPCRKKIYENASLIEKDHLGGWSPEKDCC